MLSNVLGVDRFTFERQLLDYNYSWEPFIKYVSNKKGGMLKNLLKFANIWLN